jgi:hypothetical protein
MGAAQQYTLGPVSKTGQFALTIYRLSLKAVYNIVMITDVCGAARTLMKNSKEDGDVASKVH